VKHHAGSVSYQVPGLASCSAGSDVAVMSTRLKELEHYCRRSLFFSNPWGAINLPLTRCCRCPQLT